MAEKVISTNDFPQEIFEEINASLKNYTIGFSEIVGEGDEEDIKLLGSGTLVKVGNHVI